MPNPFYQCYAAAALAAGAEPLYVPAHAGKRLPARLCAACRQRHWTRIAAVYICSPSNPEGAVADAAYWRTLFALAERHDFIVLADECYADIYFDTPPACALPVRLAQSGGFARLLTFHSLSKRSGLPGLRSRHGGGRCALIAKFRAFRNVAGPTVPRPVLAASAAAWRDEAHVAANRAAYQAEDGGGRAHPGQPHDPRRTGGFFLWLEVGNGEEIALRAWREQGVRVLPGAYMGREIRPGKPSQTLAFPISGWRSLTICQPLGRTRKTEGNSLAGAVMVQSRMVGGVYHPRAKGGAMSDALADARRALARLLQHAGPARRRPAAWCWRPWPRWWRWSAITPTMPASTTPIGRDVTNWLGPLGATAADLLLQTFGLAAVLASWRRCWSGAPAP